MLGGYREKKILRTRHSLRVKHSQGILLLPSDMNSKLFFLHGSQLFHSSPVLLRASPAFFPLGPQAHSRVLWARQAAIICQHSGRRSTSQRTASGTSTNTWKIFLASGMTPSLPRQMICSSDHCTADYDLTCAQIWALSEGEPRCDGSQACFMLECPKADR